MRAYSNGGSLVDGYSTKTNVIKKIRWIKAINPNGNAVILSLFLVKREIKNERKKEEIIQNRRIQWNKKFPDPDTIEYKKFCILINLPFPVYIPFIIHFCDKKNEKL
jgi:hypothetical protein